MTYAQLLLFMVTHGGGDIPNVGSRSCLQLVLCYLERDAKLALTSTVCAMTAASCSATIMFLWLLLRNWTARATIIMMLFVLSTEARARLYLSSTESSVSSTLARGVSCWMGMGRSWSNLKLPIWNLVWPYGTRQVWPQIGQFLNGYSQITFESYLKNCRPNTCTGHTLVGT